MSPEDSNHHVFYQAKERKYYFVGFTGTTPIRGRFSLQKKRAFPFPTLQTAEWFIWKHQPTTEVKLEIEKEEP